MTHDVECRTDGSGRPALIAACFALVALIVLVWHPVLDAEFIIFDDPIYVTDNPHVLEGVSRGGLAWAIVGGDERGSYWQPLTWLSHMLDVELFGLDPRWHHLGNLVIHIGNSLLLFLGLHGTTRRFWSSVVVAALFSVHPLNVESVAWIAERKNLLSTMMMLLCFGAYVRYVRQPGRLRFITVLAIFGIGLAAKPMLVTVPILLLLFDLWPLRRISPDWLKGHGEGRLRPLFGVLLEKLPLAAIAGVTSALVMYSLKPGGNVVSVEAAPFGLRLANAMWSFVGYIAKIVAPRDLSIFYRFPESVPLWKPLLATALLAAMAIGSVQQLRQRPWFAVGFGWFAVSLVPVLGIVQTGRWPALADRWAYVPMIGVLVLIVWTAADLARGFNPPMRTTVLAVSAATALLTLGIGTSAQVRLWRDTRTLFEDAVLLDPHNHVALMSLGNYYIEQQDAQRAIYYLERSLASSPNEPEALTNLGTLVSARGELARAQELFEHALLLEPGNALAHNAMGVNLARMGRTDEARASFLRALDLFPGLDEARRNLEMIRSRNESAAVGRAEHGSNAESAIGTSAVQKGRR